MNLREDDDQLVKDFCRLVVDTELSDDTVIEFFDIVQSVTPAKIVQGISNDGDKVNVDVLVYEIDQHHVYEIILEDQLSMDESEDIAYYLEEEFDFDFEFETSLEISQ
jgi:hypothetical protein